MSTDHINESVPTFTPPTPTFEPPKTEKPFYNGPSCYFHKGEPAVAKCARCGKFICEDCADSYGVEGGEYAGQALCYDCCQALVAENVHMLKKQKRRIITLLIATIIGIWVGISIADGYNSGTFGTIFLALWFGSFWAWLRGAVTNWWHDPEGRSFTGFIGACIGGAIVAPFQTTIKIIRCIVHWVKTSNAIKGDSAALVDMKEYMEYTLIRNQNRGVDIDTLLSQKSELANNSFARMVQQQGEEKAEAYLRTCVASINENGEIIRNFKAA